MRWARRSRRRWTRSARPSSKAASPLTPSPAAKANELFDLIDKFAGYGFNKSHAAAYALLAYQTAWLKAHHPHEFFAASMCYDMAQTDKLAIFVDDMRRLGVAILPPDVNASAAEFDVERTREGLAVRFALAALKSVGEGAMEKLVAERGANGAFKTLDDFARRVDPRLLNKRQLETLAAAGAFDPLDANRAGILAAAETILAVAARTQASLTSGQGGLFGDNEVAGDAIKLPLDARWSLSQRMEQEKEAFGFYFSAHPVDRHSHLARLHGARSFARLGELRHPRRRQPRRREHGGAGRGREVAHLRAGQALPDGDAVRRQRPVRRHLFRRRRRQGPGGSGARRRLWPGDGGARPAAGRGSAACHGEAHPGRSIRSPPPRASWSR